MHIVQLICDSGKVFTLLRHLRIRKHGSFFVLTTFDEWATNDLPNKG